MASGKERVGLRLIGPCGPGGNNETMLREEPAKQEENVSLNLTS